MTVEEYAKVLLALPERYRALSKSELRIVQVGNGWIAAASPHAPVLWRDGAWHELDLAPQQRAVTVAHAPLQVLRSWNETGYAARCSCGWRSQGHYDHRAANEAFERHVIDTGM